MIQKIYSRISNYPKDKFKNTHRNLHVEVFNMVTKENSEVTVVADVVAS